MIVRTHLRVIPGCPFRVNTVYRAHTWVREGEAYWSSCADRSRSTDSNRCPVFRRRCARWGVATDGRVQEVTGEGWPRVEQNDPEPTELSPSLRTAHSEGIAWCLAVPQARGCRAHPLDRLTRSYARFTHNTALYGIASWYGTDNFVQETILNVH